MVLSQIHRVSSITDQHHNAITDWSEKDEDYNKRHGNYRPGGHIDS